LELIDAIASRASVTGGRCPNWPGAEAGRVRLLSVGFEEQHFDAGATCSAAGCFCSPTLDRETEENRPPDSGSTWRAAGASVRSASFSVRAIRTSRRSKRPFSRFGIPSRAYFSDPLESHPAIRFLAGVVRALLGGWDHAELLALIRMPLCGVGATAEGDAFDFRTSRAVTRGGLPLHGFENPPPILERMAALSEWRKSLATPVEWTERLGALPKTLGVAIAPDVLKAWREALDVAAVSLSGIDRLPLDRYWRQAELGLALEELRATDRRRDVVHVMDAYEARQWKLPVVFVCGMVERHFPQYHREDPLLSDAARRSAGMRTSEDRQVEEKLLFELAMTRATEETY
jgi:inactivated superfamily I helicase